jgi:hypothetical protein
MEACTDDDAWEQSIDWWAAHIYTLFEPASLTVNSERL